LLSLETKVAQMEINGHWKMGQPGTYPPPPTSVWKKIELKNKKKK
jgi:hypothetical protein